MSVISPNLVNVLKRFPERKDCIQRLFEGNDSFRSLCEDYQNCAEAVRYWNQSSSEEACARQEEFAALLRDLEEEILDNLKGEIEDEEKHIA